MFHTAASAPSFDTRYTDEKIFGIFPLSRENILIFKNILILKYLNTVYGASDAVPVYGAAQDPALAALGSRSVSQIFSV